MQANEKSMQTTIDPAEIAKFGAIAEEWWDPEGKFKPLHLLNPCRLDYINAQITAEFDRDLSNPRPFEGLTLLDIGCGGGLLSEPMARLGATVTGADASGETLPVARLHAAQSGLDIEYLNTTAEDLAREDLQYDVILAMEVIEHVADPLAFLTACTTLLKPGGLLLCSTLNRTTRSYAMVVFGAERVMGWLPVGTHDWSKFITPDELFERLRQAGLEPVDKKGMVFAPLSWRWSISDVDLQVNYVTASLKPPKSSC
ncbi:MAG: bifunctional 2-polyprenyl-6-hydroxyphenol methylase/3-demethylubiquinol 3-O-methyltransferase UbiG [Pseudomonadota bacterium]